MQNESEAGNATRKSQKQRLTKKKIKTSRRVTGATSINPPKIADKVVASSSWRGIASELVVFLSGRWASP